MDAFRKYADAVTEYVAAVKSSGGGLSDAAFAAEKIMNDAEQELLNELSYDDFIHAQVPKVSLWCGNWTDTDVQKTFQDIVDNVDDVDKFTDRVPRTDAEGRLATKLRQILSVRYLDYMYEDLRTINERYTYLEKVFDVKLKFGVWGDRPTWTSYAEFKDDKYDENDVSPYFDAEAMQKIHDKLVELCKSQDVKDFVSKLDELVQENKRESDKASDEPQEKNEDDGPEVKRARVWPAPAICLDPPGRISTHGMDS